jgi:hypothetical protein
MPLERLSSLRAAPNRRPRSTQEPSLEAPHVSFLPFSIHRMTEPFIRSAVTKRPRVMPELRKEPPSGFGYPLGGVSSAQPREPFSAPHALGLDPSKFFSKAPVESRFPDLRVAPTLFLKTSSASSRRSSDRPSNLSRTPQRSRKD